MTMAIDNKSTRMDEQLVQALIRFADSHDDGTAPPRAYYCPQKDAVMLRSTELHLDTRVERIVEEPARSLHDLRNLLGY
jgi:hypothetical protein